MENKYPAVFLDRDGVINEEVGYLNHISRLKLIRRVGYALKKLKDAGFKLIVITNQSGVAKGYFPLVLIDEIHKRIQRRLKKYKVQIDDFFVCTHSPEENCSCRKPKPGLVLSAVEKHNIDLERSYLIGDKAIDIELTFNLGIKGILVLTGYGKGELEYVIPKKKITPSFIAKDLNTAADFIIKDFKKLNFLS